MAKSKNTVSVVEEILEPIIKEYNVELWDVLFVKEGASWFLKVYIDKEDGVSFNDCENVSRALDKRLDEVDPIEQSYYLEVSSTGLEREMTRDWHFDLYENTDVIVKTIRPIEGKREFKGKLLNKKGDNILIKDESTDREIEFKKQDIVSVKLFEDIKF